VQELSTGTGGQSFTAGTLPPMTSLGERPVLQRDAIIATARGLISVHGLEALSLRRLASELGVTAPALYAHVADKRDLLQAIAEEQFNQLVARFDAVTDDDPLDRIRSYGRAYVTHTRADPELTKVMFLFRPAVGAFEEHPGTELAAATTAFTDGAEAVAQAMAAGLIVADDPLLVALTLWSGIYGVAAVLQLGFELPKELEDRMVDEMTDRILRGYRP